MRSVFIGTQIFLASSTFEPWSRHYPLRIDTQQSTAAADPGENWTAVGSLTPSEDLSSAEEDSLEHSNSSDISTSGGRGLSAAAAMVVTSLTLTEAETMVSLPPPCPYPSNTFTHTSSQSQGKYIFLIFTKQLIVPVSQLCITVKFW